jgi:hypothetical protein
VEDSGKIRVCGGGGGFLPLNFFNHPRGEMYRLLLLEFFLRRMSYRTHRSVWRLDW